MKNGESNGFNALLNYLKRTRGFDFTGYKPTRLMRRIQHRMQQVSITSFEDYTDFLEVHPEEFAQLFNTILINVTDFFRDPPAWEFLQQDAVPRILDSKRRGEAIRVWSAGCASGQEAYTIAMVFAEVMGTSGLWAIKDRGGIAIVQDPEDAQVPGMPQSAIQNVEIDYSVPVAQMPALLEQLVSEELVTTDFSLGMGKMETEVNFAKALEISETELDRLGQVSDLTCPECHGTLWRLLEGKIARYRCRTGHAYTSEALLQDLSESIEAMEWAIVRGIEERAALLRHMAQHLREGGDLASAERIYRESERTWERSQLMRRALLQSHSAQPQEARGNAPLG